MFDLNISKSFVTEIMLVDNADKFTEMDGKRVEVQVNKEEIKLNIEEETNVNNERGITCDVAYNVKCNLVAGQGVVINDSEHLLNYTINVRTMAKLILKDEEISDVDNIYKPDNDIHQFLLTIAYQFAATQTRTILSNTNYHFIQAI